MRILGIDYGTKYTGLALGQDETTSPLEIIKSSSNIFIVEKIVTIIKQEFIELVVLGIPYHKDKKQENITKDFLKILREKISIPIEVVDEKNTSKDVFDLNFEKHKKIKKLKKTIHSKSAEEIIKNYFLAKPSKNL